MSMPFQTDILSLGADFSAWPADVNSAVGDETGKVISQINALRSAADRLRREAEIILEQVYAFSSPSPPDISFNADIDDFAAPMAVPEVSRPEGLFDAPVPALPLGAAPELRILPYEASEFAAPTADPVQFAEPPSLTLLTAPPLRPAPQEVTVPDVPPTNITLSELLDVGNAPVPPAGLLEFELPPVIPVEDLVISIPEVPGPEELDKYETEISRYFEPGPYEEKMMPQCLAAASQLLNGDVVVETEILDQAQTALLGTEALATRFPEMVQGRFGPAGSYATEYTSLYLQASQARTHYEFRKRYSAQQLRWRIEAVLAGLKLSVEAHSFMVEKMGELFDFDVDKLILERTAMLGLFGVAVAKFNIALADIQVAEAEFRAQVERVMAAAQSYQSQTDAAQFAARVSGALGQAYAAESSTRGAAADVFRAQVQAAQAQVQGYAAQMRATEAKLQGLRARLLEYQADIAQWGAEVSALEADYRVVRSRNRTIVAQNRAIAQQMGSAAVEQEGVAQIARRSAVEAVSLSAQLRSETENRMAEYMQTSADNAIEVAKYDMDVSKYRVDAIQYAAEFVNDEQHNAAIARQNAGVAATYQELMRNSMRAVEFAQQHRAQMISAYQGLYDSVGRADAARVAGNLSQLRATFALQASGNLDYSSQVGVSSTYSDDTTKQQSNNERREWRAATEAE